MTYFYHLRFWVTQKLPQIYTANHAIFPIRIRKITVQICGNFWVTQYRVFYFEVFTKVRSGSAEKNAHPSGKTGIQSIRIPIPVLKCITGYMIIFHLEKITKA